jgi:ATP-dependent Lhr-like helicase
MHGRTGGRIDHVRLPRVTPLAAPLFLEAGRIPVAGEARERMLAEAARAVLETAGVAPD